MTKCYCVVVRAVLARPSEPSSRTQHPPLTAPRTRRPTDRYTGPSSFPRLALVRHGRREECVGVDLILPGVHGHSPVQHLHRIGAHRLWGKEMRGRAGCGAIGAGCELSTSRSWCSILESSVTSSRLNTSCTQLCREDKYRGWSASRLTLTASTQLPRKIGRTE